MDAFYANVELLRRPELKDKPFAVVSTIPFVIFHLLSKIVSVALASSRQRHTKLGNLALGPGKQVARLSIPMTSRLMHTEHIGKKICPELLIVPVDYHRVNEFSQKIMGVCKEYHPDMYIAGCDEGYLKYVGSVLQYPIIMI